ncbi:competence protein ComEC [Pseudoalteromonas sp. S327]|uniref:ComEC/Rec2 family competence protein n=1 Tax=Pseudoalteromonas TaxID=53246 RepID=UPI00110A7C01|nr:MULTISPECIES: MBL fold metallo-hydrolase [unclassified Pseudoalteromonas]TMO03530.1 competence protein ComEC [Pseudoalteromonas sp. S327]TMO12976.1 competence protein ComEC [Pseudoalteromonas sp. S326]
MDNFYEIDFLNVESKKSGDAICLRYKTNGIQRIHVVDGGFQATGDKVVTHINQYYNAPTFIDSVVVTHPDGDHAGGLRKVLETYKVGELWMLRPWLYADELIDRFKRLTSVENLKKRLKELYPNLVALEEIADQKGIVIKEPFQGACIGNFTVMAPSKTRYLDLVVESEKTPEQYERADDVFSELFGLFNEAARSLKAVLWGEEKFSSEPTSAENEMSIVQYANLCDDKILLTGDAGRDALTEAADYAPNVDLVLPGIDQFQVPHHGSRRNVSTELLDRWLGEKPFFQPSTDDTTFTAIISASKEDVHHPRKAVVRGMIHRKGKVISTEIGCIRTQNNAPAREGWTTVTPLDYPEEQED